MFHAVYVTQLIRFARVCSHVEDLISLFSITFNARKKCLIAYLLKQGYQLQA